MSRLVSGSSSSQCQHVSLFNILIHTPRFAVIKNDLFLDPRAALEKYDNHFVGFRSFNRGAAIADLIQFGSGCSSLPVTSAAAAERAAARRIVLCRIHANLIASQMRNSFLIAMGFSFSGPREGTGAVYM